MTKKMNNQPVLNPIPMYCLSLLMCVVAINSLKKGGNNNKDYYRVGINRNSVW